VKGIIITYTQLGTYTKEKTFKNFQINSRHLKIYQNISRNPFGQVHKYIMNIQWMKCEHSWMNLINDVVGGDVNDYVKQDVCHDVGDDIGHDSSDNVKHDVNLDIGDVICDTFFFFEELRNMF
jgi:hypothetical protein